MEAIIDLNIIFDKLLTERLELKVKSYGHTERELMFTSFFESFMKDTDLRINYQVKMFVKNLFNTYLLDHIHEINQTVKKTSKRKPKGISKTKK